MKYNTGFLVNDHPSHRFSKLHENPEAQLVMLVPAQTWDRVRAHILRYESGRIFCAMKPSRWPADSAPTRESMSGSGSTSPRVSVGGGAPLTATNICLA